MRLLGLAVLWVTASSALAQANPNDWPQFRGPTGQGTSPSKNVPTTWSADENILWKVNLPGPGTSSPIVFNSKIYLTYYTGYNVPGESSGSQANLKLHLMCLDRNSGEEVWTTDVSPRLPEQAQIREEHGYASGTPAADGERIYVSFGKTGVMAFDHKGQPLWQTEVGDTLHGWGSSASPVLYKDMVIVNAGVESGSLIALHKKTGDEVWRAGGIKESWNTPILVPLPGGKSELVLATQPRRTAEVRGFDPDSGEELWTCDTGIGWYMVPSLVAQDGIVYCVGGRNGGGGLAVKAGGSGDVTGTHRLWTGQKGSNVTSPILHKGHLYWMNEVSAIAYCAEAKTGKLLYEERVPRADQIYASPVLAGDNIYYLSRGGRAFVVAAKPEFELLATNELGERRDMFNASPAITGDRLLIRSNKYLYCIGKK